MSVSYDNLRVFADHRGFVFEPLVAGDFCQQKNAHIVISQPGAVRGNHYHLKGVETMAVMGPALVRIREKDKIKDMLIPDREAYRFTFFPGMSHAIKNLSGQPNVLMAFNTIEHDPQDPDVVEDELI
jgi:dTDP-4-dehydrorhamnose 3,5-epimerase-like enzyme